MKKFRFFSFASAMLLASAAGMVSCSSDSIEPTGGPGVTGQVVKTQFAINIPYGGNSSTNQAKKVTRMTDEMTQQSGKPFRGISDIVLLTFSDDPETAGTINADKPISIGTDGNAYSKDPYRRLYRDIEIPVGTNHMLFYGKASKNTESKFEAGYITEKADKKIEKTLTNISHELTPINSTADFTTDEDAIAIISALNDIAKAQVQEGSAIYTWATIGSETTLPSWLTKHEQEFLKNRYNAFITLTAGSKTSVKACIESLKAALAGETPGADVPATKLLTAEIYKKCKDALDKINTIRDFPKNLNLPDGVAALSWTSGAFAYNTPENNLFSTGNTINYQKICYPAELSYFVNTKTMVSDKDMSSLSEFPDYNDWTKNTGADWSAKTNFSESEVTNSTKTVGLKDPVQYSVAVLQSTIKCAQGTLKDNGKVKGGLEQDQDVTVNSTGFPVTGILIGGQPASVNWKYEPATTGESFANTIYDKVMNDAPMYAKNETSASNANYTLVFDNKNATKKEVYVTIELENNSGMDFYGNDGIILKNAKFYLVGKLDPTASTATTKPTGVDRVFVQDHITKANFNIKDLKSAYNCIPDLRTSGINVGLAVDLSWKSGITFDVDI